MRTRGKLECYWNSFRGEYRIKSDTGKDMFIPIAVNEDSTHAVACWNAIETRCGGDPAKVGELVTLTDKMQKYCLVHVQDEARALLARING